MTDTGRTASVSGYVLSVCSGSKGCPHVTCATGSLARELIPLLDQAVRLKDTPDGDRKPVIDMNQCQRCGKCVHVCPSRTLEPAQSGFRILLGGRLGRHPRLALEMQGLRSREQVLATVGTCLTYYKTHSRNGKRFSHLFTRLDQVIPGNLF